MRIPAVILVLFLFALPVAADTIFVPFDQPTIQWAINAAVNGDEVVVADGVWTGPGNVNLNFKGKAITVRSGNGPLHCIIDMEDSARAAVFHQGEGTDSVLQGFTLRNGYAADNGGAIKAIYGCSPTISGNIIENCTAEGKGGAIRIRATSSAVITGNLIQNNTAASGGGISLHVCTAVVTSNRIIGNTATGEGGGLHCEWSAPELANNLFHENHAGIEGGAIHVTKPHDSGQPFTLASATVDDNTSGGDCGGLYCRNVEAHVINCIFSSNSGHDIQVGDSTTAAVMHLEYTLIFMGLGQVQRTPGSVLTLGFGVINASPQYAQGPLGNHYLQFTSDAINAGRDISSSTCFTGADGPVCMNELTTRNNGALDAAEVDLGYHYPAQTQSIRTLWTRIATTPPSGILPLNARFWLLLRQSTSPHSTRVAAVNIGLKTAGGQYFRNWRSGELVVSPGQDTLEIWTQVLPDRWSFVGENQFLVRVQDVTPPPYNQPPFQPSGGTAIDTFTFTGHAP